MMSDREQAARKAVYAACPSYMPHREGCDCSACTKFYAALDEYAAAARASGGGKCPHGHDDRHTCNDCWRASWGSTPSPDAGVVGVLTHALSRIADGARRYENIDEMQTIADIADAALAAYASTTAEGEA